MLKTAVSGLRAAKYRAIYLLIAPRHIQLGGSVGVIGEERGNSSMSGLAISFFLGLGGYFVWAVFFKRKVPSNEDELGYGIIFIRVVGTVVTLVFLSSIGVFFFIDYSMPKDERIILTFIILVVSLLITYFVTGWFEKSYLKKIDINKQSSTDES